MNAEDLLTSLEMELEKDNFDSRKTRGLLQTYLTAKYRFDVEEYILMGVSKGAPTLLFNKFKEEDPIFSKRISFRIFDLWFCKLKKEIESGKSNAVNYFNFIHNKNIAKKDREMDVALSTTKKVTKKSDVPIQDKLQHSPEKIFNSVATSPIASASPMVQSYDPLALMKQQTKDDPIWDKIPKPVLPLKPLDVTEMEEHELFKEEFSSYCYSRYLQSIENGMNKGIYIDQKGFLFDPYTARPESAFDKQKGLANLVDPLPIPINMKKPTLLGDAITFRYVKPGIVKGTTTPATLHSFDLGEYLTHDYKQTILKNKAEEIFYKIENNL